MTDPNFFIAGTTKGGTSSLHLWLGQHPGISLTRPKELHYFCRCPNPALHVSSSWSDYLDRFDDNQVRGEASPCYLYDRSIARSLIEHFPEVKILISLRDPVERFWSHYLMNEVYRPTALSAEEVLAQNLRDGRSDALNDLFGMGLYGQQISNYLEVIDQERVHVTSLERLEKDSDAEINAILDFLGLAKLSLNTRTRDKQYVEPRGSLGRLFLRNPRARRIGVAVIPASARRRLRTRLLGSPGDKPPIPTELRNRLRELYTDDSRLLEGVLGRPLPWRWHVDA